MAHAEIQHVSAVIRVFPNGTHGDPYVISVFLKYDDNETVEVIGLDKPLALSEVRAIREVLEEDGVKRAWWKRYDSDGVQHIHKILSRE